MSGNHIIKITYIDRLPAKSTYVSRLAHDGGWSISWDEKKARRLRLKTATEAAKKIGEICQMCDKPWPVVSVQQVAV